MLRQEQTAESRSGVWNPHSVEVLPPLAEESLGLPSTGRASGVSAGKWKSVGRVSSGARSPAMIGACHRDRPLVCVLFPPGERSSLMRRSHPAGCFRSIALLGYRYNGHKVLTSLPNRDSRLISRRNQTAAHVPQGRSLDLRMDRFPSGVIHLLSTLTIPQPDRSSFGDGPQIGSGGAWQRQRFKIESAEFFETHGAYPGL